MEGGHNYGGREEGEAALRDRALGWVGFRRGGREASLILCRYKASLSNPSPLGTKEKGVEDGKRSGGGRMEGGAHANVVYAPLSDGRSERGQVSK